MRLVLVALSEGNLKERLPVEPEHYTGTETCLEEEFEPKTRSLEIMISTRECLRV